MAELVYEMVWDCRYCGATKLLGLTHRHCPSCGAQQDPNTRYFPADHEKVAVRDHQFVGSDIACRYCGAPSARRAHNCGQCGAALAEGTGVVPQAEPGAQEMAYAAGPKSEPPARPLWKVALPILALLGVVVTVLLLVWKKEQRFVVVERSWSRSIEIERLGPVRHSSWCDELPPGAENVTRRRAQRGVQQVPDGESCLSQKRDRGDGTFTEQSVCSPRHKEQAVYADKCDYVLNEWVKARELAARGELDSRPRWPEITLQNGGCQRVGCERPGGRSERYSVLFKDDKGEGYRCDFDEPTWSTYAKDARFGGKLRALVGTLDCSSLRPGR
jgi:hypothetical protein